MTPISTSSQPDALLQLRALGSLAVQAIEKIIGSDSTPPAIRLRAAVFVLQCSWPETFRPVAKANRAKESSVVDAPQPAVTPKIGRNDYCPCKSGLKYKRCCSPDAPPKNPPHAEPVAA